jgi:hypothetical protein
MHQKCHKYLTHTYGCEQKGSPNIRRMDDSFDPMLPREMK